MYGWLEGSHYVDISRSDGLFWEVWGAGSYRPTVRGFARVADCYVSVVVNAWGPSPSVWTAPLGLGPTDHNIETFALKTYNILNT